MRPRLLPEAVVLLITVVIHLFTTSFDDEFAITADRISGLIPLEFAVADESLLEFPPLRIGRAGAVEFLGPNKPPRIIAGRLDPDFFRIGERMEQQEPQGNHATHGDTIRARRTDLSHDGKRPPCVAISQTGVDPPVAPCKLRAR